MRKTYIIEISMTEHGQIRTALFKTTSPDLSTPQTIKNRIRKAMSELPEDSYDIPTLRKVLEQKYNMTIREFMPDVTVSDAE